MSIMRRLQGRTRILLLPLLLALPLLTVSNDSLMADQGGDGVVHSTVPAGEPLQDEGETTPTRGPTAAEIYGVCAERGPAFYAPLMARFQIAILTPTIITKLVVETDNAEVVAMEIPYNNWTVTTTNGVATGTTTENTTPYTTFWFWVGLSPHANTKEYIDISAVATSADGSTIAHVIPRETEEQVSTDSTDSTDSTAVDASSSDTQYPMLRVPNRSQTSNSLPAEPAASSATVAPCRIGETATRSGTKNNGSSSNESSTKVTVLFAIAGIVMVSGLVGLSLRARRQDKRNKSNRK